MKSAEGEYGEPCSPTSIWGGATALFLVALLAVLETTLSFDNAVVNATVLTEMDAVTEPVDRGPDGGLRGGGIGHVEVDGQEVVVFTQRLGDAVFVASSGDHRVPGGQGRLGDVDAQASAGARHEPHVLLGHLRCTSLVLIRCRWPAPVGVAGPR